MPQINELLTGLPYGHAIVLIEKFNYDAVITEINGYKLDYEDNLSSHCIMMKLHKANRKSFKVSKKIARIVNKSLLENATVEVDNGSKQKCLINEYYDCGISDGAT